MVTATLFDARGYEAAAALGQAKRQFVARHDDEPNWVQFGEGVKITEQLAAYYGLEIKRNGGYEPCEPGFLRVGRTEVIREKAECATVRATW